MKGKQTQIQTVPSAPSADVLDLSGLLSGYVGETLVTLAEQQKHFRDPEWMRNQSAADLAALHHFSADTAIGFMEGIEAAHYREDQAKHGGQS